MGYKDIFRQLHPNTREYTNRATNGKCLSRLDYILGNDSALIHTDNLTIDSTFNTIETTHCPITICLNIAPRRKVNQPTYPILQRKIISDKAWDKFSKNLSQNLEYDPTSSLEMNWERLKKDIQDTSTRSLPHCIPRVGLQKQLLLVEKKLIKCLHLLSKATKNILPSQMWVARQYGDTLEEIKENLKKSIPTLRKEAHTERQKINTRKIKDSINNRLENFQENLGKCLSNLNPKKTFAKPIELIRDSQNTPIFCAESMKRYADSYFYDKFKSRPTNFNILQDEPRWQSQYDPIFLPIRENDKITKDITLEELYVEIHNLPKKKAPGPSRIYNEHLQHLNYNLMSYLLDLFNDCLRKEDLPEEWKCSTLVLIPKEENWTGDLKKTRPIALLEPCRRLFSKLLNRRLNKYIDSQGGLPGRNMGFLKYIKGPEIALLLRLIIDGAYSKDSYLEVIQTDIEAAYDTVQPLSLEMSFRRLGLDEKFIRISQNMFTRRKSRILINGSLSSGYNAEIGLEHRETRCPQHTGIYFMTLYCASSIRC